MSEHSPEPWTAWRCDFHSNFPNACGYQDANGVVNDLSKDVYECRNAVDADDMRRIVACVNFCQHLPTETIEQFTKEGIGPATLIKLIPKWGAWEQVDDLTVCRHCGHVDRHEEGCLLEKILRTITKEISNVPPR